MGQDHSRGGHQGSIRPIVTTPIFHNVTASVPKLPPMVREGGPLVKLRNSALVATAVVVGSRHPTGSIAPTQARAHTAEPLNPLSSVAQRSASGARRPGAPGDGGDLGQLPMAD